MSDLVQEKAEIVHDVLGILIDFIESVIHTILYVRGVYPNYLFHEVVSAYTGQLHYMSRNPTLNKYVTDLMKSMREWIENGLVEKVIISISSNQTGGGLIEQHVIDLELIKNERIEPNSQIFSPLYWSLREFFVQLHSLQPLIESDLTFNVEVEAKASQCLQLTSNLDWLIISSQDQLSSFSNSVTIQPIKSMFNEGLGLRMQMYTKKFTSE
ncbi:mitotic spindle assembly checkpoint protein MAD2B [Acrasis kona]|uniref:Mitotic spindle assembly checkpoint protein MAD2B n=1 Tax=Acrasis kona TaxID=1008807 RepID=A0AAW2ZES1_9EUKA